MRNPQTVVMKFGGTSLADAEGIARVIALVQAARSEFLAAPVVVVSAMSGVTDRLLSLAQAAGQRDDTAVRRGVAEMSRRHRDALVGVLSSPVIADLDRHFDDLDALLVATGILRTVSPAAYDAIVSTGELLTSRIVAATLEAAGVPASWVDARRVIVTDGAHTAAAVLPADTAAAIRREIGPLAEAGQVAVVGGFVGATTQGVTTTLGRGGSDYSAALIGAALRAHEVQIWTDVDGMLTADPRVVSGTMVVPRLSFAEASELAYFGAKVLHPSTMLPAMADDIPVRILNSRRPGVAGTLITGAPAGREPALAAVACKRDVSMVEITSTRMLMAHGFLRRVFEVFERHQTAVDVVTTSEVTVSVTVDDDRRLAAIAAALREFAEVNVEPHLAILCAVGDDLRSDPDLAARVLTTLARFPLRMLSQSASRRNITVVVRDRDLADGMNALHEEFFLAASPAGR